MKKTILCLLLCSLVACFAGCSEQTITQEQPAQTTMIGNPWSDWDSIEEAESAVGFSFDLPVTIVDKYDVKRIRTLKNELIEVVYCHDDLEVCVRKQKGEGQDISGDYNSYETCEEIDYEGAVLTEYYNSNKPAIKQLVSYNGYSWSLVAQDGYYEESSFDFVNLILGQKE